MVIFKGELLQKCAKIGQNPGSEKPPPWFGRDFVRRGGGFLSYIPPDDYLCNLNVFLGCTVNKWLLLILFTRATDVFLSYLFTKLIEEKYTWWTIPQHHNWFQLTFANFSLQTKSQNPVSNLVNTFAEQEQRVWQNLELQGTADRLWISANVEYRISVYRVLFQFTMCCHHIF